MHLPESLKKIWEAVKSNRTVQLCILCGMLAVALVGLVIAAWCLHRPDAPPEQTEPSTSIQSTQNTRPTDPPKPTLPPPEANPYTPEDFYVEYGILKCSKAETVLGIDVSAHQGEIDWNQLAAAGVKFAIVRIGYRGYVYGGLRADDYYLQNITGAQAAGIQVGAYFFSQALSVGEAREEAEFALQLLEGIELDLPLVFDWESMGEESRTSEIWPRTLTNITKTFCETVKAGGYKPMIYFNSNQARDLMHMEELTDYPFWLAMYDITMEFPYKFQIWQYSNKGKLPGIQSNVDLNLMFVETQD